MLPEKEPALSRGRVVTKAVVRAADRLGLNARTVSQVIGLSEATVSRMKRDDYVLDETAKPFELAALLVRAFRSLDAITGGDERVGAAWLLADNTALGGRPIDRIITVSGLNDVIAYLDTRRAVL